MAGSKMAGTTVTGTKTPIKPFLKWAGGKRQLLTEIKKQLPEDFASYTYYEPFAGGGAVLFELQPQKAVINDSNSQLMIAYNAIMDNVEGLITLLREHEINYSKDYYYQIRNIDRDPLRFSKLSNVEKAARTIFLNRTCFNGLYRVNSKGFFNVPSGKFPGGKYKNPIICNEGNLRLISKYLNSGSITILNKDFEEAVSGADKNSFIYFDPPYYSQDKTGFTKYQADDFCESSQERLRNLIMEMTKQGIKCLLSNSDTEYIRNSYKNGFFQIITVQAKRAINSNPMGRGNVSELLIKNWY